MAKLFNFLLFIGILVVLAMGYFNIQVFLKMRQNNAKVNFAEKILIETQESKSIIEKSLIVKDNQITGVKAQVDGEKKKAIELSRKLAEKINEGLMIKDELRKTRKELKTLTLDFETKEKELNTLKEENKKLKDKVSKQKKRIQKLRKGILSDKAHLVSLPREQSKDAKTIKTAPEKKQGVVVDVNDEFSFVVVNLGMVDGIKRAQILKVIRNGIVVASLRIEKVYEKMATAVILKPSLKVDKIIQADIVKVL